MNQYKEISAINILIEACCKEGSFGGLYRGFRVTLLREVPFSLIQFLLWEGLKENWADVTQVPLPFVSVGVCVELLQKESQVHLYMNSICEIVSW